MRTKTITINPLPVKVKLISGSREEVKAKLKYHIDESSEGAVIPYNDKMYIWINPDNSQDEIINYCIHESVHVINRSLEYIGQGLDFQDDEIYAYLVSELSMKLYKFFT